MNTATKGRAFEHDIREMFESAGYSVVRGAGSKGEMLQEKVDLVCTKTTRLNEYKVVLTIVGAQCKADKALNATDPVDVLEHRRQLGRQIDRDKIEKNPSTPQEVQNAARARVYRALGEKIHDEIPATVALDKTLQPNLELMSHMKSKLGERFSVFRCGSSALVSFSS